MRELPQSLHLFSCSLSLLISLSLRLPSSLLPSPLSPFHSLSTGSLSLYPPLSLFISSSRSC